VIGHRAGKGDFIVMPIALVGGFVSYNPTSFPATRTAASRVEAIFRFMK